MEIIQYTIAWYKGIIPSGKCIKSPHYNIFNLNNSTTAPKPSASANISRITLLIENRLFSFVLLRLLLSWEVFSLFWLESFLESKELETLLELSFLESFVLWSDLWFVEGDDELGLLTLSFELVAGLLGLSSSGR